MAESSDKRTYILNMKDGTKQKITVPSKWKLTFGPLVPGSKAEEGRNGAHALVLRIYEGNKDNQRAVFTGVESWRDTQELEIQVEKVDHKVQGVRVQAEGLGEKIVEARMEVREWVDPDKPQEGNMHFGNLNSSVPLLRGEGTAKVAKAEQYDAAQELRRS